jgi:hypothetical protein
MSIAQKLLYKPESFSIQELQRGVQDGTVPAYIGIPLIKDKLQQQKQAQAMQVGANPNPPTVAQSILAEAAQPAGIPTLPSNLPVATGAGGGIIAFADGGEADDDEEDDDSSDSGMNKEERMLFQKLSAHQQEEAPQAQAEEPEGEEGDEGIESLSGMAGVAAKNARHTLKEDIHKTQPEQHDALLHHVLYKESRGQRYDKNGNLLTSSKGAMGEMQVMPGTVKSPGFGVEPARNNSPEEMARVGREYLGALHNRYGNNELTAIAYNWGPGNTDKWLASGADMSKLPKETRDYVKDVPKGAAGGEVHFDKGGFLDRLSNFFIPPYPAPPADNGGYPANVDISKPYIGNPHLAAQGAKAGAVPAKPVAPVISPAQTNRNAVFAQTQDTEDQEAGMPQQQNTPNYDATTEAEDQGFGPIQNNPPGANMEVSPDNDYVKQYANYLKQRQEGVEKNYQNDKYMALLQAGLGMMGGTSPHAAANIGQGASQGVAYMANANRQRGAEENAILSGKLGLTRADLYNKMHIEQIKEAALRRGDMKAYHEADLALKGSHYASMQGKAEQANILKNKELQGKQAAAMAKADAAFEGSPQDIALKKDLERQGGKNWMNNFDLNAKYQQARRIHAMNNSYLHHDDPSVKSSSEF